MKSLLKKARDIMEAPSPAYFDGIEAVKDEPEVMSGANREGEASIDHPGPGDLQAIKSLVKGHGEQTVIPDDCEFGDNDMCYVEA